MQGSSFGGVIKTIRYLYMFAGIGGFREGLTRAGDFVCVGHCEIDKHADRSYRALFDMEGEWFLDDIRKADPADLPDFDKIPQLFHFAQDGRKCPPAVMVEQAGNIFSQPVLRVPGFSQSGKKARVPYRIS